MAAPSSSNIDGFIAESPKWADELYGESDRGCALIAAAYLDDLLLALLQKALVDDQKAFEELTGPSRALASFSSRIALAYRLGQVSPQVRADLNRVRRIRNDFAHQRRALTFAEATVAQRCSQLETWMIPSEIKTPPLEARDRFIMTVGFLSTYLLMQARSTTHPKVAGHFKLGPIQVECLDDSENHSDP